MVKLLCVFPHTELGISYEIGQTRLVDEELASRLLMFDPAKLRLWEKVETVEVVHPDVKVVLPVEGVELSASQPEAVYELPVQPFSPEANDAVIGASFVKPVKKKSSK